MVMQHLLQQVAKGLSAIYIQGFHVRTDTDHVGGTKICGFNKVATLRSYANSKWGFEFGKKSIYEK